VNDANVQQSSNTRHLKSARKELLTLRRETKTQQEELDILRDNPTGDEFRAMKQTMVNITRGKQEEIEGIYHIYVSICLCIYLSMYLSVYVSNFFLLC
jgi:hypothetical protein